MWRHPYQISGCWKSISRVDKMMGFRLETHWRGEWGPRLNTNIVPYILLRQCTLTGAQKANLSVTSSGRNTGVIGFLIQDGQQVNETKYRSPAVNGLPTTHFAILFCTLDLLRKSLEINNPRILATKQLTLFPPGLWTQCKLIALLTTDWVAFG